MYLGDVIRVLEVPARVPAETAPHGVPERVPTPAEPASVPDGDRALVPARQEGSAPWAR